MQLFQKQFKAMGSACEVRLYFDDVSHIPHVVQILHQELQRIENKYTRYKPDSITSQINDSAGSGVSIPLDEETLGLLNYATVMFEQSDGLFDITSGILRQAWDFKSGKIPHAEHLSTLVEKIGWHKVELTNDSIHLPVIGMEIDFGGFVKEYATDVLAELCLKHNINNGLINLGGDIRIVGPHPNAMPWLVGIQHPRKPNVAITKINMERGAITTSGDYERFMMVDGVRYSHLLNPQTGQSIQPKLASVSVISDQCIVAGSFSTIAMLKSEHDCDWIVSQNLPYLMVGQDLALTGPLCS